MMLAEEPAVPPLHLSWEAAFNVGNVQIDAQHQRLLAQCNRLADLCLDEDHPPGMSGFDEALRQLRSIVCEHFDTEAAWLGQRGSAQSDDHRAEADEFNYLVDEVATTENFDRSELRRFLSLWVIGHIVGSARHSPGTWS